MEMYFTDRERRLIATIPVGEDGDLYVDDDLEAQSLAAGSRTWDATIHYPLDQENLVKRAGAGGNLVLYKDRDGKPIMAEILHAEHSSLDHTHTITCDAAGVDLLDETVDEYAADDIYDIEFYISKFTYDSGWEIRKNEIPKTLLKLSWDSDDETALARILDVATQFGAELDFGFTLASNGTIDKYIDIYKKRGSDTNIELVKDVNVNNVTSIVDLYDMFTSVKAKADVQDAKGAPITLKGVSYESDDGRYVLGSDGVMRDTVAVQDWSRILSVSNPDPTTHHLQRVKTYSTGITTLSEDSPTLKQYPQKITAKQKDIASLQKRIKATNGYIANQKKYIANKQDYISDCNARIAAYTKKQNVTYPAKIAALQAELAKGGTDSHVKSLKSQIATQQKMIAKQAPYIASQNTYIANAKQAIKGYNKKIAEYTDNIEKYKKQIATDNSDIKTMQAGKEILLSQVQSKLLDMALADLKSHNAPTMTYECDIAFLPANVRIGDTVHIVDDDEELFLSARVLELHYSYSTETGTAVLGDYVVEQPEIDPDLQAMANNLKKELEANQTYVWVRYADDDQGTGISVLPAGKKYMAIIAASTPEPSDDPADYAGHWALVGSESTYTHLAYANSEDGTKDFATTPATGTQYSYLGTAISTDNVAPTDPADYTWQFFKGVDGTDGKPGTDGLTTYVHKAYADSADGTAGFTTDDSTGKGYLGLYTDTTEDGSTDPSKYNWLALGTAAVAELKKTVDALVPSPSSGDAYPDNPVAGQQFWLKDGDSYKPYQYDGTQWQALSLNAGSLDAATFNGMTFNGVTFNGSEFHTFFDGNLVDVAGNLSTDVNNPAIKATGQSELKFDSRGFWTGTAFGATNASGKSWKGASWGMFDLVGNIAAAYYPNFEEIPNSSNAPSADSAGYVLNAVSGNLGLTDTAGHVGTVSAQELEQFNTVGTKLWNGAAKMAAITTVKPSVKMSDCLNGWMLVWSGTEDNSNTLKNSTYSVSYIPKSIIYYATGGFVIPVGGPSAGLAVKYLRFTDTTITGNDSNYQDKIPNLYSLREVRAW